MVGSQIILFDTSPEHPVCLIVDGHSSHIDLDTSTFCEANGILLYCLPPHSSHVTQPLDVGLFSPLKKCWQHAVAELQCDITNTIVSDLLKLPEPKQTKRATRGTTMLPKHLSSQEMIQLLEEKKENKLKEEERKRQRKAEREQKKKQKEETKKEQKAKTASIRRGKKEKKTGEYRCLKCDVLYDDDKPDEIWIECMECMRWAHIICTDFDCDKLDQEYKCHICFI